jgi:hypothetical protein
VNSLFELRRELDTFGEPVQFDEVIHRTLHRS